MQVNWKPGLWLVDPLNKPIRCLVFNWHMFPIYLCFQLTCTWSGPKTKTNWSGFHSQIDAWTLADEHIQIFGANGQNYSLSTAWKDVTAFEKLTDVIPTFFNIIKLIRSYICETLKLFTKKFCSYHCRFRKELNVPKKKM